MDFKVIPKLPQRQDALADQLIDLIFVANRLGMYDAADFIKNQTPILKTLEYGCHFDLDPEMEPDECILDFGYDYTYCTMATKDMIKEQCVFWKPILKSYEVK
jgi:hypothetical protein